MERSSLSTGGPVPFYDTATKRWKLDPAPDEIAAMCREIQRGWSGFVERQRRVLVSLPANVQTERGGAAA